MVLASFGEILSIGAIFPFLSLIANPDSLLKILGYLSLEVFFSPINYQDFLLLAAILFSFFIMTSAGLRLLLIWASMRLSYSIGADLSSAIYLKTLYQPYSVHIARNSSEIINAISRKTLDLITTLSSALTILSSFVILISIFFTLFLIDALVSFLVLSIMGFFYFLVVTYTRKRLINNSVTVSINSTSVIKTLQEGLGGIRDVLIDSSQLFFCHEYQRSDRKLRKAQGDTQFIGQCPRFVLEALGMILIVLLTFRLSLSGGVESVLPLLGVLALGAQRLLPVLQNIYLCWSNIQGNRASLEEALKLLEQPIPQQYLFYLSSDINFFRSISFNKVYFRYGDSSPEVIADMTFTIPRGSKVGFIGQTGSGKTTVLDLLMGLLHPTAGQILVDGIPIAENNILKWQRHIAHVPQSIYLADISIAENIAFGVDKNAIDMDRIILCATRAKIHTTIMGLFDGYKTIVGERGSRLSGGQRQRIGIARALYKNADVIVLDEATSALDGSTEVEVIDAINSLDADITLIMVAHRLSTLKDCDYIFEIGGGNIKKCHQYGDLI